MNTFKHDVRDEYPSNTIQCPKLSLVVNDAYITKSLNGESKSGYDYIILDITVKNCYDSQIMFDNSMQIQNYMGKICSFLKKHGVLYLLNHQRIIKYISTVQENALNRY